VALAEVLGAGIFLYAERVQLHIEDIWCSTSVSTASLSTLVQLLKTLKGFFSAFLVDKEGNGWMSGPDPLAARASSIFVGPNVASWTEGSTLDHATDPSGQLRKRVNVLGSAVGRMGAKTSGELCEEIGSLPLSRGTGRSLMNRSNSDSDIVAMTLSMNYSRPLRQA
jgi:hypothetical protein